MATTHAARITNKMPVHKGTGASADGKKIKATGTVGSTNERMVKTWAWLYPVDGAPIPADEGVQTLNDGADWNFTFSGITRGDVYLMEVFGWTRTDGTGSNRILITA